MPHGARSRSPRSSWECSHRSYAPAPPNPLRPQPQAYARGQASERFFQDHLEPAICGIVLERQRCNDDFRMVASLRGADAGDDAMRAWLATGDVASIPKDWNGVEVTDQAWIDQPLDSWWFTAGKASIAASLPKSAAAVAHVRDIAGLLASHAGAAPPKFRGLVPSSGNPFERLRPFQIALQAESAVTPYPLPAFRSESKADAQLGVYVSTFEEIGRQSVRAVATGEPRLRIAGAEPAAARQRRVRRQGFLRTGSCGAGRSDSR